MNKKTFLISAAVAGVATWYGLTSSATLYQTPVINTLYSFGYNYGSVGAFSFTSVQ